MRLEPAARIIRELGGEAAVAKACGVAASLPYAWQAPKSRKGTGGTIPQWHHRKLLSYAERIGVPLRAEDFLPPEPKRRSRAKSTEAA